jgi:hypothetical protein
MMLFGDAKKMCEEIVKAPERAAPDIRKPDNIDYDKFLKNSVS